MIAALIWLFGRTRKRSDVPWLDGPVGGPQIGDAPYREVAEREGLTLERKATDGGLVPSFEMLRCDGFDPARAHPLVRDFYEHTTEWAMDVWSKTYFPLNIGLKLLVTTISRQVNQLNFPVSPLDTAAGISSEIINLREPGGRVRYTGWFRTLEEPTRVLYTGFYMVGQAPQGSGPCVKVVFPMPNGNATVLLQPSLRDDGSFVLDSAGKMFGDVGFYRLHVRGPDTVRVWRVRTLRENFHVFVDHAGVLRCDHVVRFWGLPVLKLHYKMTRRAVAAAA